MFLDKRRISILTKVTGIVVALAFIVTLAIPIIGQGIFQGPVPQNRQNAAEQAQEVDDEAFQEQLDALQALLKSEPKNAEAWVSLGNLQINRGDMDEAVKAYQEAVKVNPDYPEGYYRIGQVYLAQGKTDEAIKNWEKFLALESTSPLAESVSAQLAVLKAPPTTAESEKDEDKE